LEAEPVAEVDAALLVHLGEAASSAAGDRADLLRLDKKFAAVNAGQVHWSALFGWF
jgi:hypothetical protein